MPEITLKYKKKEIEDFIRQMLAMKGLSPKGPMKFLSTDTTSDAKGVIEDYDIIIECVPGELLNKCPMCQSMLRDGVPIVRTVQLPKNKVGDIDEGSFVIEDIVDATNAVMDDQNVIVDAELGESTDPPSGESASNDKGNSSMNALLATNRRLTAQRERELAQQKQSGHLSLMSGESTRPPKSRKKR